MPAVTFSGLGRYVIIHELNHIMSGLLHFAVNGPEDYLETKAGPDYGIGYSLVELKYLTD